MGKPARYIDSIPVDRPIPEDMREAAIMQEMGLRFPEKGDVLYKKGKDGVNRRNFGNVVKDSDGEIVKAASISRNSCPSTGSGA